MLFFFCLNSVAKLLLTNGNRTGISFVLIISSVILLIFSLSLTNSVAYTVRFLFSLRIVVLLAQEYM